MRVAARFVLAGLLLASFWAGGPMRPTAFALLGDGTWLDAPHFFEALARISGIDALRAWPGALFTLARLLVPGDGEAREHLVYAIGSVLGGIAIPLCLLALIGPRNASDIGLRRPSRELVPLLGVALAALVPLSLAMALHPAFRAELDARLAGSPTFLVAVLFGGVAEHFFFHGVLLAWLHPSGRFPDGPQFTAPIVWPLRRIEGRRASLRDVLRSLRIPTSCIAPCLLSAPLFFAIHIGKPDAELWLSVLAGPVLAWLAYRTNGLVAPLIVHLAASLVAALLVGMSLALGL